MPSATYEEPGTRAIPYLPIIKSPQISQIKKGFHGFSFWLKTKKNSVILLKISVILLKISVIRGFFLCLLPIAYLPICLFA